MNDFLAEHFNLTDKVAALTGAGGFLVSEICRGLGRAGVSVVCLDSNLESSEETAADIRADGGEAIVVALDVTQRSDFDSALAETLNVYGQFDCGVLPQ